MTREEAEVIVVIVEMDAGGYYGITKSQYLQALAILQEGETDPPE